MLQSNSAELGQLCQSQRRPTIRKCGPVSTEPGPMLTSFGRPSPDSVKFGGGYGRHWACFDRSCAAVGRLRASLPGIKDECGPVPARLRAISAGWSHTGASPTNFGLMLTHSGRCVSAEALRSVVDQGSVCAGVPRHLLRCATLRGAGWGGSKTGDSWLPEFVSRRPPAMSRVKPSGVQARSRLGPRTAGSSAE